MPSFQQLPNSLPVFPLGSATLLPGCELPLNIFEPRYINMLQDAIKTDQLIGMIQPCDDDSPPNLYKVGCAGRVTRYQETSDGRLEITLTGICRFEAGEELATVRGYRMVIPNWERFEDDFNVQTATDSQTQLLFRAALRAYFIANNVEVDWSTLEQMEFDTLVNSLFSYLPLSPEDKQILLESDSLKERVTAFIAILENSTRNSSTQH